MQTLNRQLKAALGLALLATIAAALPSYAQHAFIPVLPAARRWDVFSEESARIVTGLAVAALAGPFGAIAGAAAGGWLGGRHSRRLPKREAPRTFPTGPIAAVRPTRYEADGSITIPPSRIAPSGWRLLAEE
jgi:hypothetical protein